MGKPIKYVYVAGPIGSETSKLAGNLWSGLFITNRLIQEGFVPFSPFPLFLLDLVHPGLKYEDWMRIDLAWVERCDALYRIAGESPGADREVEHAIKHGLPVVTCIDALKALNETSRRAAEGGSL